MVVTALGSWGKHREGDPAGWSSVLVIALGSWRKSLRARIRDMNVVSEYRAWSQRGMKVV
jgi:hypothetical protein